MYERTEDMIPTNYELCHSCKYGWGNFGDSYCQYLVLTGNKRECPIGYCNKYDKAPGYRSVNLYGKAVYKSRNRKKGVTNGNKRSDISD